MYTYTYTYIYTYTCVSNFSAYTVFVLNEYLNMCILIMFINIILINIFKLTYIHTAITFIYIHICKMYKKRIKKW